MGKYLRISSYNLSGSPSSYSIWLCNCSTLNFLIYCVRKILFSFLSLHMPQQESIQLPSIIVHLQVRFSIHIYCYNLERVFKQRNKTGRLKSCHDISMRKQAKKTTLYNSQFLLMLGKKQHWVVTIQISPALKGLNYIVFTGPLFSIAQNGRFLKRFTDFFYLSHNHTEAAQSNSKKSADFYNSKPQNIGSSSSYPYPISLFHSLSPFPISYLHLLPISISCQIHLLNLFYYSEKNM